MVISSVGIITSDAPEDVVRSNGAILCRLLIAVGQPEGVRHVDAEIEGSGIEAVTGLLRNVAQPCLCMITPAAGSRLTMPIENTWSV
jgi:hypothetical protein